MNSKQAVLTTLGCAGSLAAMLAVASPAIASPTQSLTAAGVDEGLPTLTQSDSNPIMDALGCGCARCAMGDVRPAV